MLPPVSLKWTLTSLIGSYLNLAITYLLLVGSSLSFLVSEFLSLFNLGLSCPCSGLFASDMECIHSRIESVQGDILTRFPYDVMLSGCRPNKNGKPVMKVEEFESNFDDGGNSVGGEATPISEYYSALDTLSSFRDTLTANDNIEIIKNLEHELEEAQAAYGTLYLDLEKERKSAATAAEEAMAMILRLQSEKAAVEMESRQYQRLIDEKSAYDEEEREILKEIIIMREREKHFLEKEVEAYRRENLGEMTQPLFEAPPTRKSCMSNFAEDCNTEVEDKDIVEMEVCPYKHQEREYKNYSGSSSSQRELGSNIFDIHVIDDKHNISLEEDRKTCISNPECEIDALDIKTPITIFQRSSSGTGNGANSLDSKSVEGSSCHARQSSMSAVDGEIFKLETEVESLRKRLKTIQKGRESLKFPQEYKGKDSCQLPLLEEIARQLQEIRKLTRPGKNMHRASLPSLSTKEHLMKRWRNVSSGLRESA